jgi:hypothetical protein
MKKINDYIKYLLTLILLEGIKVFAQTTENLSQISSQANQELSNFLPSNSSFVNSTSFSEIIKQSIDKLGYYFINYALPFLFVFGVLTYLTYESKKELNRPLLLIYLIIAFLATEFFHAVIIILALVFVLVLIFVGIHKIFHGITGSIIGSIIVILLAYIVLTNSGSIIGFLPSLAFYILLFILFIIMFIYGYKLSQSSEIKKLSSNMKKLKKIIYHIRTPQDVRDFQNTLRKTVDQFNQSISQIENTSQIEKKLKDLVNTLQNVHLSQQRTSLNIKYLINLLEKFKDNIKDLHSTYRDYIEYLDNEKAEINSHYDDPLRSYLLKILEEEEKKIEDIAKTAYKKYNDLYKQLLLNRQKIIDMAIKDPDKRKINDIFNQIGNLLHNFRNVKNH